MIDATGIASVNAEGESAFAGDTSAPAAPSAAPSTTAPPAVGAELPAIVIDRREQAPWTFGEYPTVRRALYVGNYSLEDFELVIAVERMSLAELVNSFAGEQAERERFSGALRSLRTRRWHAIIVTADWDELRAMFAAGDADPEIVLARLGIIIAEGTLVLFASSDAERAARVCEWLLARFHRSACAELVEQGELLDDGDERGGEAP